MKDLSELNIVASTSDWDELLEKLGTRHVQFVRSTEKGFLYSPIGEHGLMDPNPSVFAEYIC